MISISGYAHRSYVETFAEFGAFHHLMHCNGWILKRSIPGTILSDAMGCYPFFSCQNWNGLKQDLESLQDELVNLSLVTDPFGDFDAAYLKESFRDVFFPFKQHFVIDLDQKIETHVNTHHRRNTRKALQQVQVEKIDQPLAYLDDWVNLYQTLIERHQIMGITVFSKNSFAGQLTVPGLVAFRAVHSNATVGMLLWYIQDDVAYYHLGAYSSQGYQLKASFALFWTAIEFFQQQGLAWLSLGAGAGASGTDSGLTRFKQGWATGTRTAYFCGRIFDHDRYAALTQAGGIKETNYFPAYRQGEFR